MKAAAMDPVTLIIKKRDGHEFSRDEIRYFIEGYTAGGIPDYQAAAWLMAVFLKGMSNAETAELTVAMAESGEILDLSEALGGITLDKHSSGGVGDKTSLVVLPLVAASGVPVAKMSGRGLDFTGGTLDKLESIRGFNTHLTRDQFIGQARQHGIVLAGQSADLAPADGRLYSLRDATGTVPSKPLIASSIMSKKIAAGADAMVLDVKVGVGAFMPSVEDARDLARIMVAIGVRAGRRVTALLSDMNQPLGHAVGNALEVREAIDTLEGRGPADFIDHCLVVAGHMLRLAGRSQARNLSDIMPDLKTRLTNGEAWRMFRTLVEVQGGDISQIEQPDTLPSAPVVREVVSPRGGVLSGIHAREVGLAARDLGAGRTKKEDPVDHAVGIVIHHKVGDHVEQGAPLFTIHARTAAAADRAERRLLTAHTWAKDARPLPIFYDVLFSDDLGECE